MGDNMLRSSLQRISLIVGRFALYTLLGALAGGYSAFLVFALLLATIFTLAGLILSALSIQAPLAEAIEATYEWMFVFLYVGGAAGAAYATYVTSDELQFREE